MTSATMLGNPEEGISNHRRRLLTDMMVSQTMREVENNTKNQSTYHEMVTISAISPHTHTIIVLQNRSSNAKDLTLSSLLPNRRVLDLSTTCRACAINHALVRQWFDIYSIEREDERSNVQYDGLQESCSFLP
jgi:hypothetical protein